MRPLEPLKFLSPRGKLGGVEATVGCPVCYAPRGKPCTGPGVRPGVSHKARVDLCVASENAVTAAPAADI